MCKKADRQGNSLLIAITGGLGTGKSSVLSILKTMGYACIDVDRLAKQVLEEDREVMKEVRRNLGEEVVDGAGRVKREVLRELIISDEKKREALEAIAHPRILALLKEEINRFSRERDNKFIFVEVPLLFEVGWEQFFDLVVCVWARDAKAIERVSERHGIAIETAREWFFLQMPLEEKVKKSHYVLRNVGDKEALVTVVENMVKWLTQKQSSCRSQIKLL